MWSRLRCYGYTFIQLYEVTRVLGGRSTRDFYFGTLTQDRLWCRDCSAMNGRSRSRCHGQGGTWVRRAATEGRR
jgi:hypothetical protein